MANIELVRKIVITDQNLNEADPKGLQFVIKTDEATLQKCVHAVPDLDFDSNMA